MDFKYAHKNTEGGERATPTAQFNKLNVSAEICELRRRAFEEEIPVSDDETLQFLRTLCLALKPRRILELGTAIGVSGIAMLQACPSAKLITVERSVDFHARAVKNFADFSLADRAEIILGDAGEVIGGLCAGFDLIFLDCAKAQYIKYLPVLKKLLNAGGVLLADDVLLFGYVSGEVETPKKRRMLAEHIREYIEAVTSDPELETTVLDVGNGVAMSVKK